MSKQKLMAIGNVSLLVSFTCLISPFYTGGYFPSWLGLVTVGFGLLGGLACTAAEPLY